MLGIVAGQPENLITLSFYLVYHLLATPFVFLQKKINMIRNCADKEWINDYCKAKNTLGLFCFAVKFF